MRLTVVLPLITAISSLTLCLSSLTLILPLSVTLFLYCPSFYSISHLNYSIIVHNNNFVLGKCRAQSFLSACEIRKLHLRFITSKVARTPLSLSFVSLFAFLWFSLEKPKHKSNKLSITQVKEDNKSFCDARNFRIDPLAPSPPLSHSLTLFLHFARVSKNQQQNLLPLSAFAQATFLWLTE